MPYLFVIWPGDRPVEKVFTSLRLALWANVLNKLLSQGKNSFLMMFDSDTNRSFVELIRNSTFINDGEHDFLQMSSADQQQTIEKRLRSSNLISYDSDDRMLVNIEHLSKEYLLKSSNETTGNLLT